MTTLPAPASRSRELTALLFLVSFYLLAFAITAAFFWLARLALTWTLGLFTVQFALVFGAAGILTLWAVLPRFERFRPGGVRATPEQHPALFALIGEVADASAQPLPWRVYLTPEVNASVADVGGLLGVGSRRVLWLGLPLFELLSEAELRAVIAHEYGHYVHGDTRLGP